MCCENMNKSPLTCAIIARNVLIRNKLFARGLSSSLISCSKVSVERQGRDEVSTVGSEPAAATQEKKIEVPLRKARDELSVLRALASTVKPDYNAPHFKYIDDPFLIPTSSNDKRLFSLAKVSGRKAAQYVVNRYPGSFAHDSAIPPVEKLMPPKQLQSSADSLEGLRERLDLCKPLESFESYQKLKQAGIEMPEEHVQDLLNLLCFYNSDAPGEKLLADELFFQRDETPSLRRRTTLRKTWKADGPAEEVFKGIAEPSAQLCCIMIRGRVKYGDVNSAYELFKSLRLAKKEVDVKTYNAIIGVSYHLCSDSHQRLQFVQDLLADMASLNVTPDVDTFDAVFASMYELRSFNKAVSFLRRALCEMNRLGLEPSLTSWYYVVRTIYNSEHANDPMLYQIVDFLKGKQLSLRKASDYNFFATAMSVCYSNFKDIELGYKIEALLDAGNNRTLLGDVFRHKNYYTSFLQLLCTCEKIEAVMTQYDKLVPHVLTPSYSVLQDILTAIEINEAYHHLPRIWSDLVLFQYTRRTDLVERLLSVMAKKKQEQKLQELFTNVASNIYRVYKADMSNTRLINPFVMTGGMIGNLLQVFMFADRFAEAWDLLQLYLKGRHRINGFPSEQSLVTVAEECIRQKNVEQSLEVLSLVSDFGYGKIDELVNRVSDTMELTEQQRTRLKDLL